MEPTPPPTPTPPIPTPIPPTQPPANPNRKKVIFAGVTGGLISLGLIGGLLFWVFTAKPPSQDAVTTYTPKPSASAAKKASTVDLTKLPLGDGKYASSPKQGYIYTCQQSFNGGGAFKAGPWINQSAKTWDATGKVAVSGDVDWPTAKMTITPGGQRVITTNALPDHTTGNFPIRSTDPAYQYDRNPSSIKANNLSFNLPLNPAPQANPQCIFGEVGILLTGAVLFDAFDAGGRDAVAWELQDKCAGHPNSLYHYHGYTSCVRDNAPAGQHSDLVGYAFDGFGIYGLKGEDGQQLTSADLDECHGHTHSVKWDGATKSMYHYHLTRDFPYSVACFKGARSVNGPLVTEGQGQPQPPPPRP